MATTSRQPNPIPVEEVVIDVSVAYGYPVDPQPQPQPLPSAATTQIRYRKMSEKEKRYLYIFTALIWIVFLVGGVTSLIDSKKKLPRFQLDSVSLNRGANTWDIGFSIDKAIGNIDVWVRFVARDYTVESVGTAGNSTVSVRALLPQGFDYSGGGLRLELLTFRCNNYKDYLLEAACKDVPINVVLGFSSNETSTLTPTPTPRVMEGGPRLCPVVKHEHV